MLDKATAYSIAKQYADVVANEMSPEKIYIFGSYVHGTPREESDIDIAVLFDGFEGNWYKTAVKLSHLVRDVSTYIEPVALDARDDDNDFLIEVLRTGELIHQKQD